MSSHTPISALEPHTAPEILETVARASAPRPDDSTHTRAARARVGEALVDLLVERRVAAWGEENPLADWPGWER